LSFEKGGFTILSKPRILCVDDEPSILRLFESLLAPHDYEIIKTQNGQEALEKNETASIS